MRRGVPHSKYVQVKNMRSQYGFTLIEIIIVVVILGIMASLAIPKILGPNERIRAGEGVQVLTSLLAAQKGYFIDPALGNNAAYAAALGSLDITIPTPANFNTPNVYNNSAKVADITRKNGPVYTLAIDEFGSITCSGTCTGVCKGGGSACN